MITLFKKGTICNRCGNTKKDKELYCNTGYVGYDRHIWNDKPLKIQVYKVNYQF